MSCARRWLVGLLLLGSGMISGSRSWAQVQMNLPNRPMQPMAIPLYNQRPLPVRPLPGNCLPGMDCLGSLPRPYMGTYERPNPYEVQQQRDYGSDDE